MRHDGLLILMHYRSGSMWVSSRGFFYHSECLTHEKNVGPNLVLNVLVTLLIVHFTYINLRRCSKANTGPTNVI